MKLINTFTAAQTIVHHGCSFDEYVNKDLDAYELLLIINEAGNDKSWSEADYRMDHRCFMPQRTCWRIEFYWYDKLN